MKAVRASSTHTRSFECERCHRPFFVVIDGSEEPKSEAKRPSCCVCGGYLAARSLPAGVYEATLRSPSEVLPIRPDDDDRDGTAHPPSTGQEADIGYGKSHGYAPGHGGPTGPGDAPASDPNETSETNPLSGDRRS